MKIVPAPRIRRPTSGQRASYALVTIWAALFALRTQMSSHVTFFFNDTATTQIYTLSLHDALPISLRRADRHLRRAVGVGGRAGRGAARARGTRRRRRG